MCCCARFLKKCLDSSNQSCRSLLGMETGCISVECCLLLQVMQHCIGVEINKVHMTNRKLAWFLHCGLSDSVIS